MDFMRRKQASQRLGNVLVSSRSGGKERASMCRKKDFTFK